MILTIINWACLIAAVLMISIFLHELGHHISLKQYGKKPKIKFKNLLITIETPLKNMDLTNKQYENVLLSGVVWGALPIMLTAFWFSWWVSLGLILSYIFGGAWPDIKNLIKSEDVCRNHEKYPPDIPG